jgi:cyanophycinase
MRLLSLVLTAFSSIFGIYARPAFSQPPNSLKIETPDVQNRPTPKAAFGTLVLHGGGHVSQDLRTAFTKYAGGSNAKIVIVPTADVSTPLDPGRLLDWKRCNPRSVQLLHAESHEQASHVEFSRVLDDATGVWFSGGKQGYLVSIYDNTPVVDRIKKLIQRGGVVGGTSAGAAAASTPMLIYDRMQKGFEFFPGTIVDQHFLAKGRLPRLQSALEQFPTYVGFGIDEATALVVRGTELEVLGESTVTVCLAKSDSREPYVRELRPGEKGDLTALKQAAKLRGTATKSATGN